MWPSPRALIRSTSSFEERIRQIVSLLSARHFLPARSAEAPRHLREASNTLAMWVGVGSLRRVPCIA